jgi:hypothetical protein
MKKLVILLMAIALGMMLLWTPLSAMDRDPTAALPWMESGAKPNGDGDPWNEADSSGDDGIVGIVDLFKLCGTRYFVVYFISTKIDYSGSVERDALSNNTDIPTDRNASSR